MGWIVHLHKRIGLRRGWGPQEFMFALRRWLKTCFDLDPEDGGDCMPHGQQNDTFSCRPATGNTIAHDILGCPLWSPKTAVLERVRWFLKFVENIPSLVERYLS